MCKPVLKCHAKGQYKKDVALSLLLWGRWRMFTAKHRVSPRYFAGYQLMCATCDQRVVC